MKIILVSAFVLLVSSGSAQANPNAPENLASDGYTIPLPPDGGGSRWRRITCFVKDAPGYEYTASGYRQNLNRVKRAALRRCERYSNRPSTCRILRCR